jgi:iron complex transport system substrate-binding protein
MKKTLSLFLCLLLIGGMGCNSRKKEQAASVRTITDMAGRQVVIPSHITSAFVDRHSMQLIYAFDTVLPVNAAFNYSDTEKKFLKKSFYENKPYVLTPSVEEILKLKPDVIFSSQISFTDESLEQMEQLQELTQTPVILMAMDILNYKETLAFMGDILEKEDKARELTSFIETYFDPILSIAATIPEDARRRVYYAEGMEGERTDPSGSIHSYLIDLAGAINVAQVDILPEKGMANVSLEQVYAWNPELILVWSGNFDNMDSYRHILSSPAWANLSAVKNHKVYQVPWKPFGWIDRPPALNRLLGFIWLSNLLYPDYYKYDSLIPIAQDFFQKFYHYDMTEEEAAEIMNPQPKL